MVLRGWKGPGIQVRVAVSPFLTSCCIARETLSSMASSPGQERPWGVRLRKVRTLIYGVFSFGNYG